MAGSQKVVYAAKNVQQAYLLRNTLEEMGVRAVVYNASLEGGSGVDYIGWNTLARVVVDEHDYETARRIALDYDRAGAAYAEEHAGEELPASEDPMRKQESNILNEWPCCPNCRAARITQCPVCKTMGSDFPEADPEYVWGMGLAEIHGGPDRQGQEEDGPEREGRDNRDETLVLMCPICDEPFLPEFPNRCAMCSHRFADGFEVELQTAEPETINGRMVALVVGLGVLLAALLGYFWWITRWTES